LIPVLIPGPFSEKAANMDGEERTRRTVAMDPAGRFQLGSGGEMRAAGSQPELLETFLGKLPVISLE
jgi:hypothetical protein